MARTKQTARQYDSADHATEAASQSLPVPPPPGAPPPPPLPSAQKGDQSNEAAAMNPSPFVSRQKGHTRYGSSRSSKTASSGRMFNAEDYGESKPKLTNTSVLNFVTGDDLIVGKSRLRSVDRSTLKPCKYTLGSFRIFLIQLNKKRPK
jgi:hypothetical protein